MLPLTDILPVGPLGSCGITMYQHEWRIAIPAPLKWGDDSLCVLLELGSLVGSLSSSADGLRFSNNELKLEQREEEREWQECLSSYELYQELGRGNFAKVLYGVSQGDHSKHVAIKVVDSEAMLRFKEKAGPSLTLDSESKAH